MVVHLWQRPSLRAGVTLREGVFAVAAHASDYVAVGLDDDAAHRGADPTEASDRLHGVGRHRAPLTDPQNVVNANNAVNDNIVAMVRA